MKFSLRFVSSFVLLVVVALVLSWGGQARADILVPSVSGTVEDSNNDGTGDFVVTNPTFPFIRRSGPPQFPTSNLADAAILEYNVSAFQGLTLTDATLTGLVSVNNALPTGPRIVEIFLFSGNGIIQPTDFEAPGISLGTVTYQPEAGIFSVPFNFNVLGQVQSLLNSGATHVGVRFSPVNVQAPGVPTNIGAPFQPTLTLNATPTGTPVVPEPSSLLLLGVGTMGLIGNRCRRKR